MKKVFNKPFSEKLKLTMEELEKINGGCDDGDTRPSEPETTDPYPNGMH